MVSFQSGYMWRGRAEADRAAKAAAAAQAQADERLATALETQRLAYEYQLASAEKRARERQKTGAAVASVVEDIKDEPVTFECARSPAVGRALERLRELETTRAGRS